MSMAVISAAERAAPCSSLSLCFARRHGFHGERMNRTCKFFAQNIVDTALSCDPALPFKLFGHNDNPEMGLARRRGAGMACVQM